MQPQHVAVTGAAGQIGYQLLFRIAAGDMLGKEQPIVLQLLEIPQAMEALEGVRMELMDSAFPLLQGVEISSQAEEAFDGADVALLVGARPRGPGMERSDLLQANAQIFSAQGKALNAKASPDVRVLVVGNPANTNALIAAANAPRLDKRQITAMTRLDHNRGLAQLAQQTGTHTTEVTQMTIWGNHSSTQFPDLHHCKVRGKPALEQVEQSWYRDTFIPTVQQRGAAIIKARGSSSAASAASSAIDHVRDWVHGSEWTSMAIPADGNYGIESGVVYSYPVRCRGGDYEVIQDLDISDFARERMDATNRELREERDAVEELLA